MHWDTAVAWADGYGIGSYSDWRRPASDTCEGDNCTGSEMGHLWYVELGNVVGVPLPNLGNFLNLSAVANSVRWSGTEFSPEYAHAFRFNDGAQVFTAKMNPISAMAVRDGDVAAIPEPQTYALLLLGLAGLVVKLRRRAR